MPNDAERALEDFLAALPAYKRKEFEHGLESLSHQDFVEYTDAYFANAPEQASKVSEEYIRLLARVPAKLRAYRKREADVAAKTILAGIPTFPAGRPAKEELANEAARLKRDGLSYAKIALRLNLEHGEGTTTRENIRSLLRSRRLKSRKVAAPPDKTQT